MFKYCSFSEYSLVNIINNELYMNHFESFNDPFECRCEILQGFPEKNPECPRFRHVLKAWGFDDPNDHVAVDSYDDYMFSLEDTEPVISNIIDRARISCFSKRGDNLLMWSHYADGLRGFCIEFDFDMILPNSSAQAFEVLYDKSPSIIDTAVIAVLNDQAFYHEDAIYSAEQVVKHLGADRTSEVQMYREWLKEVYEKNTEIYKKMLATKPLDWSYEEEVRIIIETTNPGKSGEFLKYPGEAIKSVIVGEKMPERQRQVLYKVLERHPSPVTLKKATRAKGGFGVAVYDDK